MGKQTHCPEWEERLSLYVDGVLNPFDENAVEAHLARCAGCRATVALWREVGAALRQLPESPPPAYLREWILASTTRARHCVPHRKPFPWRAIAPAAAAALLLGWFTLPRPEASKPTIAGTSAPAPMTSPSVVAPNFAAPTPQPNPTVIVLVVPSYAYQATAPQGAWFSAAPAGNLSPFAGTLTPSTSGTPNTFSAVTAPLPTVATTFGSLSFPEDSPLAPSNGFGHSVQPPRMPHSPIASHTPASKPKRLLGEP